MCYRKRDGAMESKGISNVNFKSRLRQILVLAIVIVIGVLISQAVQAKDHSKTGRSIKSKSYRAVSSQRACKLLAKKRMPKRVMASRARKTKVKPMAEIDTPKARR